MIEFELPFPPAELSPNARIDWHPKAKHIADYRQACAQLAKSARVAEGGTWPLPAPVNARYTFVLTSRRRRDFCNLYSAFKAGEDGIVDAGLIGDDNAWNLQVELAVELGEKPSVIVSLWGAR